MYRGGKWIIPTKEKLSHRSMIPANSKRMKRHGGNHGDDIRNHHFTSRWIFLCVVSNHVGTSISRNLALADSSYAHISVVCGVDVSGVTDMWTVVGGIELVKIWMLLVVPFSVLGLYAFFPKKVRL